MDLFLNPGLLAGAGLAAVPVVLHLIMRQKPRHLEFPALRFIQQRHDSNRRRLRLRLLLLLLLRMGVICLLALALARPTVDAPGVLGEREGPVAAAFVFDTQPHMMYRHDNQTRLDAAREMALWILPRLPDASQVGVLDGRTDEPVFQVDPGAAKQRIGRLDAASAGRPVCRLLDSAAELLAKSDLRREIYVFTDLARGGWSREAAGQISQRLQDLHGASLYLIDVGVEKPQDYSLGEVRLSSQVLARNTPLGISADISATGASGQRVVELYLLDSSGSAERRGRESVQVSPGAATPIEFTVTAVDQGTRQGYLRIIGEDGLAADDVRYFTAEVRSAWKLLVVAPQPATEQALYLTEALAPAAFRKNGQARFSCDVVPYGELSRTSFEHYAAVFLLDPPPLADAVWQQLGTYTVSGGGLALILGGNANPDEFNKPAAQELLPGTLGDQARSPDGDLSLATEESGHPLLVKFRPLRGTIPWEAFPVYRYWQFATLATGTQTIIPYGNGRPALVEKPLGKGRVVTMTTPLSEAPNGATGDRWNLLPTGFEPWPFVMLSNELALYLVGGTENQLNYLAGQSAMLPLAEHERHPTYQVVTPRDQFLQAPNTQASAIIVTATETPGNYRVKAGGETGFDRGFSVNLPLSATTLDRITEPELKELFGDFQFRLAREPEQIEREVSTNRVGHELFPLLIAVVAVLLGLEHVLANRFYRQT